MTAPISPADGEYAEYIAHDEFRNGLPHGRFRVIVNPDLARRFVAARLHLTAVALALIGPGIALALTGHALPGALLVALGVVLRRLVRWQASKILLQLATRQPGAYHDATSQAVMEVRRVG